MPKIVNNDKLSFVLTTDGLELIRQAISSQTFTINIAKAKVGDANEEFYTPSSSQKSLVHPLPNGEFPIIEKELMEDGETVSFLFKIPSSFDDCDIREVGLYALTEQNEEILVAIGTQQPIVKPAVADNYLIYVDYYIMLKSVNLATVYDQIKVDPYNKIITENDLKNLMSALLFTQGNLSAQIGNNSTLIGLNRGTLLFNRIMKNLENYGNSILSRVYSSITTYVQNSSLFGYWLFNYSSKTSSDYSITNLCYNQPYLSCNKALNTFLSKRVGLLPSLTFGENDYFYLDNSKPLYLSDLVTQKDLPFSMIFAVEPLNEETFNLNSPLEYTLEEIDKWRAIQESLPENEDRTLLARSNYSTGSHSFEIIERVNGSLQIKLFSDDENYLTFTSEEGVVPKIKHSVLLSYNNITNTFTVFVNNTKIELTKEEEGTYTFMSNAPSSFYGFTYSDNNNIWADNNTNPKVLYTSSGSLYKGTEWVISSNKVYFNSNEASYNSSIDFNLPTTGVTSYIINEYGQRSKNINSNVCLVSIINGNSFSEEQLRMLSLNVASALGLNPCLYL